MGVRVRCRKSNHHNGCQKRCRDQKKARQVRSYVKVMLTVFFDSEGVFTTSFYHKAGQSIRSIIWKLCNVFMRQSGKKDLMRGGRIDGCSNVTTCPHIHRSLSVTSWPNTRRLSFHSLRTLQISHQLTYFCFQSSNNAERPPF